MSTHFVFFGVVVVLLMLMLLFAASHRMFCVIRRMQEYWS